MKNRLFTLALAVATASLSLASGPTSTLYLVNEFEYGTTNGMDRVQGATISGTNGGNTNDYAIAVSGDVRTCGYFGGFTGSKFDLAGNNVPGGPYANFYAADPIYDGTSDGTYNYGVGFFGGQVLQYDRNWLNPVTVFTDNSFSNHSGITMNTADGSCWLSQYGSAGTVSHFSSTGTLLSSFVTGRGMCNGLAYDPADGTLWLNDALAQGVLFQYSQSGTLLQIASYSVGGNQFYGMEFDTAATPEPASMAALAVGVAALVRRRKAK